MFMSAWIMPQVSCLWHLNQCSLLRCDRLELAIAGSAGRFGIALHMQFGTSMRKAACVAQLACSQARLNHFPLGAGTSQSMLLLRQARHVRMSKIMKVVRAFVPSSTWRTAERKCSARSHYAAGVHLSI